MRAARKRLGLPANERGEYALERLVSPGEAWRGVGWRGRCRLWHEQAGEAGCAQFVAAASPVHFDCTHAAPPLIPLAPAVGVTAAELRGFVEQCTSRYEAKRIDPGSTVGAFGAQSIGEGANGMGQTLGGRGPGMRCTGVLGGWRCAFTWRGGECP